MKNGGPWRNAEPKVKKTRKPPKILSSLQENNATIIDLADNSPFHDEFGTADGSTNTDNLRLPAYPQQLDCFCRLNLFLRDRVEAIENVVVFWNSDINPCDSLRVENDMLQFCFKAYIVR